LPSLYYSHHHWNVQDCHQHPSTLEICFVIFIYTAVTAVMMSFINGTVMILPPNQLCKTQTLMLSIVEFQGWSVYSPHARTVQSPPVLFAKSLFVAAGVLVASTPNINEKEDKSTHGWYVHGCALKIHAFPGKMTIFDKKISPSSSSSESCSEALPTLLPETNGEQKHRRSVDSKHLFQLSVDP